MRLDGSDKIATAPLVARAIAVIRDLPRPPAHLTRLAAPAISIAILGVALFELYKMDWHAIIAIVPESPLFWAVFVIAWCTPVIAEWSIYRQIWPIPRSALGAMVRKAVGNDLLIGYAGETYLYSWARRAGQLPAAAFGAVKDVSILSASVGSAVTLIVAVATTPFLWRLHLPIPAWAIALSLGVVLLPPLVAMLGRKRLFHLPGRVLARITAIHIARATAGLLLTALLWHLALPAVALGWWVIFSALKTVLSRLPLVSNRDLVFAGVVTVLLGHQGAVPALMAMMATLSVCANIVAGVATSASIILEPMVARLKPAPVAIQ